MATIILKTFIKASCETCFDLSRSIDLHANSMNNFGEKAIEGRLTGLIGMGETVTWRARHFFVWHEMTSAITRFKYPTMFRDEMVAGPFKELCHDHIFSASSEGTTMTDIFQYTLPCPRLTGFLDSILFQRYMRKLLEQRNAMIKQLAESGPIRYSDE